VQPNRRTSVHGAVATALALSALLAGCGGGSGGSHRQAATAASAAAATTPASTATVPRGTAKKKSAASRRRAHRSSKSVLAARLIGARSVLRLADLPAGFVAKPRAEEASPPTIQRRVAGCLHARVSELHEHDPREVTSPKFKGPGGVTITSSVAVLAREAEARRYLAIVEEPQAPACIAQPFGQAFARGFAKAVRSGRLPAGVRLGQVSAARLPFAHVASQSVALRIQVPVIGPAGTIAVTFDALVMRSGPAIASLSYSDDRAPVSRGLEEKLALLVAGRLATALGG
jgi:hypothetical protein